MEEKISVEIQEVKGHQLEEYKQFLAYGLVHDEDSFRITPGDDLYAPFPTQNRVDSFTLGAYVNNELLGIVSFERDGANREKLRHKGILFRMYVAKEGRSRGIARQLIESTIARVRNIPDIEQINLTVISNNVNAKALYEKLGFQTFAHEKKAIKWQGKYFDEDQMVLSLRK
jgi:RimJ/RimL family protein N-acetyltransferase